MLRLSNLMNTVVNYLSDRSTLATANVADRLGRNDTGYRQRATEHGVFSIGSTLATANVIAAEHGVFSIGSTLATANVIVSICSTLATANVIASICSTLATANVIAALNSQSICTIWNS
jgi:ribulose-5-phosphate 4-epimerase/fuculose-1-phosphate aldolase